MPDIESLTADLKKAEAHVRQGEEHIRRQKRIIAVLERDGHNSGMARDVLSTFERIQEGHIAHRDRLAVALGEAAD
ncbi:MAG TPA: hypothetical protein VHE77_02770 [Dongiaceae bacterium]|jgi:hypothetical protein|nr:hypothetical protein [Dongiaceae bacterium]